MKDLSEPAELLSSDTAEMRTEKRIQRIEAELNRLLPDQADEAWFSRIIDGSGVLSEESHDAEVLNAFCTPARDLISRGGKRWRPLMMVWLAEMLGGTECAEIAYGLTPVVEYPHNGSLIVDDIEDESEMRRGRPAVHTLYGVDQSINAGNLMYFLPTSCIDAAPLTNEQKLQVYQIYSKYLRRVHFGQGFDIYWHNDRKLIPGINSYEQMCRLKTGCLAGMAAEIGAAAADAEIGMLYASGRIAETMGFAFQIRDDVQNLTTGNPGKMRGDDFIEGKKSLPLIIYAERFPEKRDDLLSRIDAVQKLARELGNESDHGRGLDADRDMDADADADRDMDADADAEEMQREIETIIGMMQDAGVIQEADGHAHRLFDDVISEVRMLYPDGAAKEELLALFDRLQQ